VFYGIADSCIARDSREQGANIFGDESDDYDPMRDPQSSATAKKRTKRYLNLATMLLCAEIHSHAALRSSSKTSETKQPATKKHKPNNNGGNNSQGPSPASTPLPYLPLSTPSLSSSFSLPHPYRLPLTIAIQMLITKVVAAVEAAVMATWATNTLIIDALVTPWHSLRPYCLLNCTLLFPITILPFLFHRISDSIQFAIPLPS